MSRAGSNRLRIAECGLRKGNLSFSIRNLKAGFSLIELIMVILLISLALGVSYPALSRGTAAFHLRATGRDILNTLRYAREKAITEQTTMKVTVDPAAQKVILSDEVGNGSRVYNLPLDVRIQQVSLAGQELRDLPLVIRFMTNGSCEDAEIQLVSNKGGTIKIVTDPIIGGARILTSSGENAP